jgi:hypothetical protein
VLFEILSDIGAHYPHPNLPPARGKELSSLLRAGGGLGWGSNVSIRLIVISFLIYFKRQK